MSVCIEREREKERKRGKGRDVVKSSTCNEQVQYNNIYIVRTDYGIIST